MKSVICWAKIAPMLGAFWRQAVRKACLGGQTLCQRLVPSASKLCETHTWVAKDGTTGCLLQASYNSLGKGVASHPPLKHLKRIMPRIASWSTALLKFLPWFHLCRTKKILHWTPHFTQAQEKVQLRHDMPRFCHLSQSFFLQFEVLLATFWPALGKTVVS